MKKILFSVAAAALMSTSAFAATNGSPGVNSTGNADINVTIDPFVSITNLDDLTINIAAGNINGSAPTGRAGEAVTRFCVFSNVDLIGRYRITATSFLAGSDSNPFGLTGPDGTQLNYLAFFTASGTASPFEGSSLERGIALPATTTAFSQPRPTDFNCSNLSGSNAAIGIGVRNSVALAALAGTYTGTLTVTVAVP